MKLKPKTVNGYNILVNENAEINEGDYVVDKRNNVYQQLTDKVFKEFNGEQKIIFSDPELNLDLPQLPDWVEFEVDKLAKEYFPSIPHIIDNNIAEQRLAFKRGYNHNKSKYTEEYLRKVAKMAFDFRVWKANELDDEEMEDEFEKVLNNNIQSLKKLPKYIVVESERTRYPKGDDGWEDVYRPKLITLPNGKQTGIIKEVIWEH